MTYKYILALLAVVLFPTASVAEPVVMAPQLHLDHVWTMIAAALVLFMQVGFMLLEAGSVRSKNSVSVAQKNLIDFLLSSTVFGLIGFALMFGASWGGWIGWQSDLAFFGIEDDWALTFFVFQMVFCGTAAIIVSGAIAERMTMTSYLVLVILIAAVIYPVAGHWAWGGLLSGDEKPFLAKLGFMDFAGSTVVHSVGAWVGLAAAILVGPKTGRFDQDGKPIGLHGHSPILAAAGALIIWIGWIGFNGGSTTAGTPAFAKIVANTMVAGAVGGLVAGFSGFFKTGFHHPEFAINGALAGLVGITAGCDAVSLQSAAMIGAAAAIVSHMMRGWLLKARIDDPLGAIFVHGGAGALGTLLVAAFAPDDMLLAGTRIEQVGIQLLGTIVFFVWSFGVAWLTLKVLSRLLASPDSPHGNGLRVPLEAERIGLNEAEHRTPLGMTRLTNAMRAIVENEHSDIQPLVLDPGDETFEPGFLFNQILERQKQRQRQDMERKNAISAVMSDVHRIVLSVSDGDLAARMPQRSAEFDGLVKGMNDLLDTLSNVVLTSAEASKRAQGSAIAMQEHAKSFRSNANTQVERVNDLHITLEQLRERVLESHDALRSALDVAHSAADTNVAARKASAEMVDRIAKSAQIVADIGQSIETIDDIAFQTRLLSVNASVEAARAKGTNASGFKVVAGEVRVLANQTANTASAIRSLIAEVNSRSNDAQCPVAETDDKLLDLIEKNDAIATTVQILEAVNEQIFSCLTTTGESINAAQADAPALLAESARTQSVANDLLSDATNAAESTASFHLGDATPKAQNAA